MFGYLYTFEDVKSFAQTFVTESKSIQNLLSYTFKMYII